MRSTQQCEPVTKRDGLARARWISCLVLLLGASAVAPSEAQHLRNDANVTIPCATGAIEVSRHGEPSSLLGLDLRALSRDDWREVRQAQLVALESQSESGWTTAAQNVSYLSTFYREQVDLEAAALPLMQRYVQERKESNRIMALAAIVSIGHRDTMARLAQRVQTEGSVRVRRLTEAAIAEFYGERTPSEIVIDGPGGVIAAP